MDVGDGHVDLHRVEFVAKNQRWLMETGGASLMFNFSTESGGLASAASGDCNVRENSHFTADSEE